MPTPDELRAPIAQGRVKLEAAIRAAASNWTATTTDDDWSPKKTAEHVIPAEAFFTAAVCKACGYAGIEFEQASYESAEDALTALAAVSEVCDGRLKYLTEEDLAREHERMGSVVAILQQNANHLVEHAAQIEGSAST